MDSDSKPTTLLLRAENVLFPHIFSYLRSRDIINFRMTSRGHLFQNLPNKFPDVITYEMINKSSRNKKSFTDLDLSSNVTEIFSIDLYRIDKLDLSEMKCECKCECEDLCLPVQNKIIYILNYVGELQHLNCSNLKILYIPLEKLGKIKKLDCVNSNISSLPKGMKQLEYLDCSGCNNLLGLPNDMDMLISLICNMCEYLKVIPKLNKLESLDCSECYRLTSIECNNLKFVDYYDCLRLSLDQ